MQGQSAQPAAPRASALGRIGTRAALITALMLAVIALFAGGALTIAQRQADIVEEIGVADRAVPQAADALATHLSDFAAAAAGSIAGTLPPALAASRLERGAAAIAADIATLDRLLGPALPAAVLRTAAAASEALPGLIERLLAGMPQPGWQELAAPLQALVAEARQAAIRNAADDLGRARALAERARVLVFLATLLGLAGVALTWFVLIRQTARPLGALAHGMERIAAGDAATPAGMTERADQVGEMARAVEVFRRNLLAARGLVEQALDGARRTAAASEQASAAIGRIASGAAAQQAALRQVGAETAEGSAAVQEVGRTTRRAAARAAEAQRLLEENLRKLHGLIETVAAVDADTARITRIAGTIAGIATQTNILAINAAIEAARAGEHGRGLSVVAEEVRALATNTEALAGEIAEVVRTVGDRARDGARAAGDVGAAMDALGALVADSAALAEGIAAAMEAQQASAARVQERVGTLTRIGEANTEAAEELGAAMAGLSRLAAETRAAVESAALARGGAA